MPVPRKKMLTYSPPRRPAMPMEEFCSKAPKTPMRRMVSMQRVNPNEWQGYLGRSC